MLSKSAKYTLKAVLFLAINSNENKRVMIKDIVKSINAPQAYIAKLLQKLAKQNIISSKRGPKGGFYLSVTNRQHSILDVINAIQGEKKLASCLLSLNECDEHKPCPLHNLANPSRSKLLKSLNNKSINDLSLEIESGKSFLSF